MRFEKVYIPYGGYWSTPFCKWQGSLSTFNAIELAGQAVANIYDYMYALDTLKPGVPVDIVYMRGSEKRQTTLTPIARQ